MNRSRRLGVIVPVSNTNLEPDLQLLCPRGVSVHCARLGGYDLDAVPDAAQMRRLAMSDALDAAADALAACKPEVVLYGCTSATLACGPAFDRDLRARIKKRTGAPTVSAASAVVEALRDLDAVNIGYASPYTKNLNDDAVAYLKQCGVTVVARAQVAADLGNYGQSSLTPDEVFQLARDADADAADAVLLSCTDMRAVETIDALENFFGKPVVSSNQALMHSAVKCLSKRGVALQPPRGFGRLLSASPSPSSSPSPPSPSPLSPSSPSSPSPRPSLRNLAPYPLAAPVAGDAIRLDQNESAVTPSAAVVKAFADAAADANRYADGACTNLRERLGEVHGLDAARIVCGNGSGELLNLLIHAYADAGDEVLSARYAYLYFDTATRIAGATPVRAGDKNHIGVDLDAILNAVTARTKIVCIDNPGNPTGAVVGEQKLRALRESLRDDILLVVDAAYAEYATRDDYDAGASLVNDDGGGGGTVMLRTFSKIYGLAAARVGWAYCPPAVASVLNRARLPNNVAGPSQAAAVAALDEQQRVGELCAQNDCVRGAFVDAVGDINGVTAHDSEGNFVLVEFADADADAALRARGIVGRPMHAYDLAHCIRFTVGAAAEMDAAATALREIFCAR